MENLCLSVFICEQFALFLFRQNFLHTPDLPVGETNFDAVRMAARIGQQIFDDADGSPSGSLILL